MVISMAKNPRTSNRWLRIKHRARLKAMAGPCAICQGRLGPIKYDEPADYRHPLSFVIDEIIPVSLWQEYGYASKEAAAQDWNNLQPAHYICNQMKSNRPGYRVLSNKRVLETKKKVFSSDGDW